MKKIITLSAGIIFSLNVFSQAPAIQWQKTIGGSGDDEPYCILPTATGGYVIGGSSASNISGNKTENSCNSSADFWIVKTNTAGNIQWQNTLGGDGYDGLRSMKQTADGGYILAGNSVSNISCDKKENCMSNLPGYNDYWVVKTDA